MKNQAQKIADSLSDAQKRLLLSLHETNFLDWKARSVNVKTRNKLATSKLTEMYYDGGVSLYFMRRLSPLGKEVKAILEKQDGA